MSPAQVLSVGSRRRKEQRYRSVISDIFDGSILSLVQCLTCDRVCALRGEGCSSFSSLGGPPGAGGGVSLPFSRGRALVAGCPGVGEQALCLTPASWWLGLGVQTA